MTRLRTILPVVTIGFAAVLGIVGCSAGQVTQTDSMEPAVNGNRGQLGNLALRDVMIAYPESGTYVEGEDAQLVLTIVNTGPDVDRLVGVTSPIVDDDDVKLMGNPTVPGRTALRVVVPEPGSTTSSEPPESSGSATSEAPPSSAPSGTTPPPSEGAAEDEEPAESVAETTPAPTGSEEPEVVGVMSIVFTELNMDLPFGRVFPVTFVFENAGQVTIDLPISAPATPRAPAPADEAEGGH